MRTKEEIEKFLKDLQLNPKYIVFNFNEGSQYDLEDLIQRALNHFKPKTVISNSEIKKLAKEISKTINSLRMKVNYKFPLDRNETDELLLKLDVKFCEFILKLSTTVTEQKKD